MCYEYETESDSRVELIQGEITQGGVAGIVVAWLLVPSILYGIGMFLMSKL